MNFNQILRDIEIEFNRARMEDPSHFRSRHEGYAFLAEEVDELWDEVKKKAPPKIIMYEEAKQIATVAIEFMLDCCDSHETNPHDGTRKQKFCHHCDKPIAQNREKCGRCGSSLFYYVPGPTKGEGT